MIDAVDDIAFPYPFYCLVYERLVAVLGQAHELLRPQVPEVVLHFAEHKFYWVRFRIVGQIVHPLEAQFAHGLLRLFGCMDRQIVHKDADLVVAVRLSKSCQILLELFSIDRLWEYSIVFPTFLF